MGEAHMKPFGKILTLARSFSSTCASAPSTSCRKLRFSARTKAWKAARSKSTSESHMTFLSRIGTSDMTRQRMRVPHTLSLSAGERVAVLGYLMSFGKGLSACAASKGSPVSCPYFMSSRAVRHGSVRVGGVSFSTSLSTVAPPSSELIKSSFSRTMKCTSADKECKSFSKDGSALSVMPCISGPSFSNSCACQFKQNLKSTLVTPCRCISALTAGPVILHRRPLEMRGWMILAS
mmetsp:Transcript_4036/g.9695  ORF Transcript_4036/g.9695 Transcript_4036/m.9695 type:complete len:235 (+) Transcript_4036:375-1079(+)